MTFQVNAAVQDDLRAAIEYYSETAGSEIAIDFYEEFRRHAELAASSPRAYAIYMADPDSIRRVNFRRFPYHFLYRQVDATTIRILVVCHDHRHPSYGLDRW
jgi:plasmid stabilization system protein ParE